MGFRLIFSLCLLVAGVGVVASCAEARPLPPEPEFHSASLKLRGSNGYAITVGGFSQRPDGKGEVVITASRGNATNTYVAPGLVTETIVRADFGSLGMVDLVLHPSGVERKLHLRCTHTPIEFEPGTYEGRVEFRGEEGFTRAQATAVPLAPFPFSLCGTGGSGESAGSGIPGARIHGISFAHGRALSFQVNKNGQKARVFFQASLKEKRGEISIYRTLEGFAPSASFRFDPQLRTAKLSPPAPFSGSASLVRTPTDLFPQWSGDLSIQFPGHKVSLVGPSVHVSIVHARLTHSGRFEAEVGF